MALSTTASAEVLARTRGLSGRCAENTMSLNNAVSWRAAPAKAKPAPKDDITPLKADHTAVSQLFAECEKTRSTPKKKAFVANICASLSGHAQIEGIEPDGEMHDAKAKVLSAYVKHHVGEEQNEMFPKAKASSLDMADLGARMAARKSHLTAQVA